MWVYIYIYIYTYLCLYICVCVYRYRERERERETRYTKGAQASPKGGKGASMPNSEVSGVLSRTLAASIRALGFEGFAVYKYKSFRLWF